MEIELQARAKIRELEREAARLHLAAMARSERRAPLPRREPLERPALPRRLLRALRAA